ncbi:MAG: tryptophan--tRNA ligase [Balneolaceae bacterium]
MKNDQKTILSGIQPSGELHLGNYFGAMRQHIRMQTEGDAFYFLANYHSLTSLNDRDRLREYTEEIVLDYLALGLDPEQCTIFAQSDVPQTTELAWILGCLTPVSMMEKGVSYKDKVSSGLKPNIGLFTYPVLQAADILIYRSNIVPVGEDQKQNIEIARDLAGKFNRTFGDHILTIPEEYIVKSVAVVPGVDGRKMSKSYGNTIGIFEEGKSLGKRVMSIKTDSAGLSDPKDPERCNVFSLIRLFASPEKISELEQAYRNGGYGYGDAKKELLKLINEHFSEARERREKLGADRSILYDILKEGGNKARERAEEVMEVVRSAAGLTRNFTYP